MASYIESMRLFLRRVSDRFKKHIIERLLEMPADHGISFYFLILEDKDRKLSHACISHL